MQILRLDDETRREETFQKIGDSEILNLDSGDEIDDIANDDVTNDVINVDVEYNNDDAKSRATDVDVEASSGREDANKTLKNRCH